MTDTNNTQPITKTRKPMGGFAKGALMVAGLWMAYSIGAAQSPAAPAPLAATPAASHAKPAPKRPHVGKSARPIRVACGAYSVTFNPHDYPSRSDAIEAAVSYSFDKEGCEFK